MGASDSGAKRSGALLSCDIEFLGLDVVVNLRQDPNERLDSLVSGVGGLLSR